MIAPCELWTLAPLPLQIPFLKILFALDNEEERKLLDIKYSSKNPDITPQFSQQTASQLPKYL